MKKFFRKEVIIGATVLATLLILFFGIDYLKGINIFRPANYYYVTYNNVNGLAESAPVTVNGFKVGLVREISYEYDNPGNVRVELSLDKELKIPFGTKALIATDMLGTASIELLMASSNRYHEIGDKIIGENKTGLMDNVSTTLLPAISQMIPHIDSLVVSVTALASNPSLTASLNRLDGIMSNLEKSTMLLNQSLSPAPGIINNASTAMADVKKIAANLNSISSDLTEVSATLKKMPLDSTMCNINQISENLLTLSRQLNNPNSSLGLLMNDPSLYNNINNSAAHIDSILIDLKKQPKRYIPSIKIF